ncbi:MAG TPA: sulfite oxidase [Myxococcaceae bacterium]|nr:sulfite oxidase [Myxococcaceae bacterium]
MRVVKHRPFNAETPPTARLAPITETSAFFVRNHFGTPALSAATHTLHVDGAVERPLSLGVGRLQLLGARKLVVTLECAGNSRIHMRPLPPGTPWDHGAVSTGEWTGVPLYRVLEQAGLRDEATHLLFEGADGPAEDEGERRPGYQRALPREKALHPDTLLVWGLNGEPLPRSHGGPLRLLVPGWYGMDSVKWLARITARLEPFTGRFQGPEYTYDLGDGSPPAPVRDMRVKSQLLAPDPAEPLPLAPVELWGRAWAGTRAIRRVEVDTSGTGQWEPAELREPARPYGWVLWRHLWTPSAPGMHMVRVRAWDADGRVQPEQTVPNRLGYGEHAIQVVRYEVLADRPGLQ